MGGQVVGLFCFGARPACVGSGEPSPVYFGPHASIGGHGDARVRPRMLRDATVARGVGAASLAVAVAVAVLR